MKLFDWLLQRGKEATCSHVFSGKDMQCRDENGIVRWPCKKCGKVFEAHCGLDILSAYGPCDGDWS